MAEDQNNQPNGSPEPSQKAKVAKPEKRNLEDLWQQLCLFHSERGTLDDHVYQHKWSFPTLEDALEEGGELHNERVYLFGLTERQINPIIVPVVVAVVSPFPPTDEIVIAWGHRVTHEIVPMKQLKMDWVPYIPLKNRESQIERRENSRIFTLSRTKSGGLEHGKKFVRCFPYFLNPLKEDKSVIRRWVDFICPKPQVDYQIETSFQLGVDELEDFVDEHMEVTDWSAKCREPFKDFVQKKVEEVEIFNHERCEALSKAREELTEERRSAFEKMRFYKFYPGDNPNKYDLWKVPYINQYYGKAHVVI